MWIVCSANRRSFAICAKRWHNYARQRNHKRTLHMETGTNSKRQPARLLIVDDEVPQMKALCDTLRDRGYETTGFASAVDAVAAMRDKRFDLLLSDLTMPGMDGISLLQTANKIDPDLVAI